MEYILSKYFICYNCLGDLSCNFCCIGKRRTAHKPHSKPKVSDVFEVNFQENGTDAKSRGCFESEEDLWARLEELERQEEMLGELDRYISVATVENFPL